MLNTLYKIEEILPDLLKDEGVWKSLYIDFKPIVERLWTDFNGVRVYLHRIHPCKIEEALFHKHPWPSAMRIVEGTYEMGVGQKDGDQAPLEMAATIILPAGSAYEMVDPSGWHYVRPLETPTLSLMVAGPPWWPSEKKSKQELKPLSRDQRNDLLMDFCDKYN